MDAWARYVLSARRSARRVPATMSASSGGSSPRSSELPLGATAYEGRGLGGLALSKKKDTILGQEPATTARASVGDQHHVRMLAAS